MARVAIYLQDKHEIREGMEYAQYAEQRGFEAIWQAESRLVRDAIVPMAAFAAVTSHIKVGSGVLNNLVQQHPELGTAWFGVAPRVSLVARDWGGARRLAGGGYDQGVRRRR